MFNHLHIHSYYSMMWGTAPIDALAKYLVAQGQTVFPLTDRNGIYGMTEHIRICREYGLRPIIGCELVTKNQSALCLVKTREGYRNLCNLLDAYYHDEYWQLDRALLERHQGLVVITSDAQVIRRIRHEADLYVDLRPDGIAQANERHETYQVPQVVTCRAYMISEKGYRLHRLLRAIDTNSKLSRLPNGQYLDPESRLFPNREVETRFANYPKALKATEEIAEACTYVPELGELIFPPSDYDHCFKALREKSYAGAYQRYGKITDKVKQRLDYELDIIRRKGFSNCFLVVEDVVRRFSLTCGRGSAAASIVSYALQITHVDPIAHNLFFERFLNPGRKDPPDIDIDFAWDERDQVREYLWRKYGGSHIAMVCNHNRLQMPSAIRELAKVHGLGDKEIADAGHKLARARRVKGEVDLPAPWPDILNTAKQLVDYPRHISVHCGGVVITPDTITNHCPLRPMPIGFDVVPWDKDGVEDYGFVKLDFLGNRSLAVIRDTISAVNENYGVPLTYTSLNPLNDLQTASLIRKGETMGCFYVESPATRQLLHKVQLGDFETLVAVSSIIRPAANTIAHEWVRRHRHMDQEDARPNWNPVHPKLEEVLEETHGLMIYQEDVTRAAMAVADFDSVDGDGLRKVLSKKHKQKQLRDYKQKFIEGCQKNGLNEDQIGTIWEMMLSFAAYSFCKPHSASYAMVSFKAAFLKFHYPAEFLAAVISNRGGFYSTFAYLSHARRMGLAVLGPDINDSRINYRGYNGRIRMGFRQIKGLHLDTAAHIIEIRDERPFEDLSDFMHRVSPCLEEVKRLILAGAFDEIEQDSNRPTLLWKAMHWAARHGSQSEDLFPNYITEEELPHMDPYSSGTRLVLEKRLFGFPFSQHPLSAYKPWLQELAHTKGCDLKHYVNRMVTTVGVMITGKTVHTKNNEPMCFLTFEDETDLYEAVMFPDLFKRRVPILEYGKPFIVKGMVTSDMGALSITLHELSRLDHLYTEEVEEEENEEPAFERLSVGVVRNCA